MRKRMRAKEGIMRGSHTSLVINQCWLMSDHPVVLRTWLFARMFFFLIPSSLSLGSTIEELFQFSNFIINEELG